LAWHHGAATRFVVALLQNGSSFVAEGAVMPETLSPTVQRFHRRLGFRLIDSPDLLSGRQGQIGTVIIRAAVKALGLTPACALFADLDENVLEGLTATFLRHDPTEIEGPLRHFFGRASTRIGEVSLPELQREMLLVAWWLGESGLADMYPRSNSTWRSLLRRAENAVPDEAAALLAWYDETQKDIWVPPLPDITLQGVNFESIATTGMLLTEGEEMGHCISAYEADLKGGLAVAFQVTGTLGSGVPVRATSLYVLGRSLRRWRLQDIRGELNARVPAELRRIAREAEALFNQPAGDE
jgi:hypothetical protein